MSRRVPADSLGLPRAFLAMGSLGSAAVLTSAHAGAATIDLDPGTTHQTMSGWEAVAWASQDDPSFSLFRDEAFDLAVEAGLNRVRLEIRSSAENDTDWWQLYQDGQIPYQTWRENRYATVNDNADAFVLDPGGFVFSEMDSAISQIVLPLKSRVEANGETFYINLNYVAFTSQIVGGNYEHDDPEEYAEFMEATWLHLDARYGWVPDGLEILLEPDNVSQWNGTLMGQAVVSTMARLAGHGYTPDVIVPSNTNMGNVITYFDDLAAVTNAVNLVTELSYHRYGGVTGANLQAIVDRANTYGLDTSMLEWWSGGNSHEILHEDLTAGRNSAWQQGAVCGVAPANMSFVEVDVSDPGNPEVALTGKTELFRQYYKWVRRDAVRIEATSNDGGFEPIGFVNADGGFTVVVKADAGGTITLNDLPAATYGITYTTESEFDVSPADQVIGAGQPLITSIPQAGVITVYRRGTAVSVPGASPIVASRIRAARPNPFSLSTELQLHLAEPGVVRLEVFDVAGRLVRTILDEPRPAGPHTIAWDGRDDTGGPAPAGVYSVRLSVGDTVDQRKIVLTR